MNNRLPIISNPPSEQDIKELLFFINRQRASKHRRREALAEHTLMAIIVAMVILGAYIAFTTGPL